MSRSQLAPIAALLLAVAFLLGVAACSKPESASDSGANVQLAARQQSPLGFSVEPPAGWTVSAQNLQSVNISSPDGGSAAFVRVKTISANPDTVNWLAYQFLKSEPWAARWQAKNAATPQPGVARISYDITRADGVPVTASAVAIRSGRIVTVMLAAAPAQSYEAQLPALAATLQSFRFESPAGGAAAQAQPSAPGGISYVVWTDPKEGAFSMEVPQGWAVEGGVVRPDASGVRNQVVMTAPDNRHIVWYGDWSLPRIYMQAGSAIRDLGGYASNSSTYVLAPYQDAPTFAAFYLQKRFGPMQITRMTPMPDVEARYAQVSAIVGKPQERHSAALVDFQLADGRVGAMQLVTSVTPNGFDDGATWLLTELTGFVSAPSEVAVGAQVFAHGRRTTRTNPQWFAAEMRANAGAAADFARSRDEISAIQAGIVEQRWGAETRIAEQRGQVLSGTTELVDPQTGERFETQAGSRYYFRDVVAERQAGKPMGQGAEIDFNPSPGDFRRLLEVQAGGAAR